MHIINKQMWQKLYFRRKLKINLKMFKKLCKTNMRKKGVSGQCIN